MLTRTVVGCSLNTATSVQFPGSSFAARCFHVMVLLIPRCLGYKAPVHRIRLCILHDAVDLSPFQTQYWLPLVYWQPGSLVGRSQRVRFGVASYQYWVKQSWINFIRFRFQPSWGVMVIQSFIHAFFATGPHGKCWKITGVSKRTACELRTSVPHDVALLMQKWINLDCEASNMQVYSRLR